MALLCRLVAIGVAGHEPFEPVSKHTILRREGRLSGDSALARSRGANPMQEGRHRRTERSARAVRH